MADALLTIEEMVTILDPPLTVPQLRALVQAVGLEPQGARYTGRRGRPGSCYKASELMRLHAAVVPLMPAGSRNTM